VLLKIGWSKIRHILGSSYVSGGNCRGKIHEFLTIGNWNKLSLVKNVFMKKYKVKKGSGIKVILGVFALSPFLVFAFGNRLGLASVIMFFVLLVGFILVHPIGLKTIDFITDPDF
jgi:hypothetical protein